MSDSQNDTSRVDSDRKIKLEFHGSTATRDAGLLAYHELDGALGLTSTAATGLHDTRTGQNSYIDRYSVQSTGDSACTTKRVVEGAPTIMEQRPSPELTIPSDLTSRPPGVRPTVPEVRGQVPANIRTRSLGLGLAVFLVTGTLYVLTFWGILAAPAWPLQVVLALANGICIGTFFVVGHDACHGSLTPFSPLNQGLARLAFLPSLTPFTSWEFAHNRIHHAYTNLRSKDYAWAPFSKSEYDRLPPRRRWLERHYRSLGGLGTYYFIEYWLKHLLFPSRAERRAMKRTFHFALDLLLVAGFAACEMAVIIAWSSSRSGTDRFWGPITALVGLLVLVWLLPFLIWNWSMGFAIYQHHNHPRIPWYDQRAEWDFFAGQVESTTHVQLPWVLEWVMAHIMQHTAHHVDPKIPLYRLPQSQRCLEQVYPQEIVVESWSIRGLIRNMARCKLYDYENHRWLNFDGRPTTEPHPLLRALREGTAPPRRRSTACQVFSARVPADGPGPMLRRTGPHGSARQLP